MLISIPRPLQNDCPHVEAAAPPITSAPVLFLCAFILGRERHEFTLEPSAHYLMEITFEKTHQLIAKANKLSYNLG